MNALVVKFLTSYLIMPLMAVILTFVAYLISKKNKLFPKKKTIFFVLLIGLLLSIPGLLGFLNYEFMPYYYVALFILYLFLGWCNIGWMRTIIPGLTQKDASYIVEFFVHFIVMFIGAAFFSLIFNLCNELQYGFWACTCVFAFIFPSLFSETYKRYMDIPLEVHKTWYYSHSETLSDFEYMDYNKLMVMELEFFKQVNDKNSTKVKVKAPDNLAFGIWFQKFIVDYNVKFPVTPIELKDGEKGGNFGWIFYVKRSFFLPRKYVDFELTIPQNGIGEKHTIIAKRVSKGEKEKSENSENSETNENSENSKGEIKEIM